MADVFVSYARSDKAIVAPLVAAIEAAGWSVWWDPEIAPGQEFDRQEPGRREPTGAARALLRAIRRDPKHVIKALEAEADSAAA